MFLFISTNRDVEERWGKLNSCLYDTSNIVCDVLCEFQLYT